MDNEIAQYGNEEINIFDIPNAQPYDDQTQENYDAIMKASVENVKKKRKRINDNEEESSSKRIKSEDNSDEDEESPFYEERLTLSDDDEMPSFEEQIEDKTAEIKNIKDMIKIHETDMNRDNKDYGKPNNVKLMNQYKKTLSILEEELKNLKKLKETEKSYGGNKHNKTVKKKSYRTKKGKTAKKSKKVKKRKKGKSKKRGRRHKKTIRKKKGGKKGKTARKEKSKKSRK